jgi:class 3 adenylate cyclase
MTSWTRRRGFFEEPARVLYHRAGARYFTTCAQVIVLHGIAVSLFGLLVLVLYVNLSGGEVALFGVAFAAALALEGALAAFYFQRAAAPARAWLRDGRPEPGAPAAWSAAARLPLVLVRSPTLYMVGALGVAASDLLAAAMLGRPAYRAALLFPMSVLLYISGCVLRYVGLELAMRPVLRDIGESLREVAAPDVARVSLHQRLLATVPMVTWGTAMIVGGLVTHNTRDLDQIGLATGVAVGVTTAVSMWLSLVLADSVSGPIIDLRNATRRLGEGDLGVRVQVVSTDETGELAAAFNATVAGLAERERLREAFGSFVDPALTDRVLAEGMDLGGEEIDASVLFLDVRGFTEFAERAPAQKVVAALNELYELVVPVIERHGGHANKFVGDGLMAVFGAPERHADHAARALAAAREIAARVRERGGLRVGLGVNSGRVVAGTIGGGGRRDFTVIGDAVNTAARVEAATRATGDDILITESTLRALGSGAGDYEERPAMPLKGKSETVRLYAVRLEAGGQVRRPSP